MATVTLRTARTLNDISDDEIRKTFSFLPHIVKIVKAASTSSATEPLLLKNSVSSLLPTHNNRLTGVTMLT